MAFFSAVASSGTFSVTATVRPSCLLDRRARHVQGLVPAAVLGGGPVDERDLGLALELEGGGRERTRAGDAANDRADRMVAADWSKTSMADAFFYWGVETEAGLATPCPRADGGSRSRRSASGYSRRRSIGGYLAGRSAPRQVGSTSTTFCESIP